MSVLGLVPARGGSKGIPGKNARTFLGVPLVARAIAVALESGALDRVIVSTDDEAIAAIALAAGGEVPFVRPEELAQDDTPTAAVVQHALVHARGEGDEPDVVVVLEPTSPGRTKLHVLEALALLRKSGADSVASVSKVPHHYVPSKQLTLTGDGALSGPNGTPIAALLHRRQDLPVSYAFDGVVYACRAALALQEPPTIWGERVVGYVVDPRNSVDLDRPEDWAPAEAKLTGVIT
ncbi:MAG: acylneuraminate cytidylyltransferase family protein [Gaiellaceae bacterium]